MFRVKINSISLHTHVLLSIYYTINKHLLFLLLVKFRKEMLKNVTTVKAIQCDENIKYENVRGIFLTQAGLSVALNVIFLVVLATNRDLVKRRRVTYHVGNLAMADSLFGLSRFCSNFIEIVKDDSSTLLKMFSNISNGAAFASFSAILFMAIERVVVLRNPFTWVEILPLKRILLALSGNWAVVLLLIISMHFALDEMHLAWFITVLLIIFCTVGVNIYIYRRLQWEKRKLAAVLNNQEKSKLLQYKSCVLVLSLAMVLVITCLPHMVAVGILFTSQLFHLNFPSLLAVRTYLKMFANLNFLVNPIIYIWSVRIYRQAFYRTFNMRH